LWGQLLEVRALHDHNTLVGVVAAMANVALAARVSTGSEVALDARLSLSGLVVLDLVEKFSATEDATSRVRRR
jgi:hypothetical protein